MDNWHIFRGNSEPHDGITALLDKGAPPWRTFSGMPIDFTPLDDMQLQQRMQNTNCKYFYQADEGKEVDIVNVALYLRRPLLVTGKPGSGKSSLADAIAFELKLGRVLRWPINSRSILQEALYRYDAIGRLQEANLPEDERQNPDIGRFITLGPLGTALLPTRQPQVLLIDEIDKSDLDLPNDLLNIFEEGWYEIPELTRHTEESVKVRTYNSESTVAITKGRVTCYLCRIPHRHPH